MNKSSWISVFNAPHDSRYAVKFDGDQLSSNDGDVCISFVTHDYLKNKKDPYCVDIGADKGWWAIFCCEQFPTAHVDAFEPNTLSYDLYKHLRNKYPNLYVHPYAISDTYGTLSFTKQGPDSHSRDSSDLKVPCVRIDPYFERHEKIDLIKMDTEGHELVILKTLLPWFSKIGALIFECSLHWYGTTMKESIQNLEEVLNPIRKTHPFIYLLSRRDEPVLIDASNPEGFHTVLELCYKQNMQFDCFLSREPFAFASLFVSDMPLRSFNQ